MNEKADYTFRQPPMQRIKRKMTCGTCGRRVKGSQVAYGTGLVMFIGDCGHTTKLHMLASLN